MNKKISFFLLGSFLGALGLGFLNASINRNNISKVDAANSYLEFKDDVATLGKYPQTISHDDVFSIKTYGTLDTVTGWYTYNNKTYAIKTVELDADYRETEKFNDGSYAKNYENIEKVFLVEDLKWEILSIKDGYANIISTRVIDRQVFDNSNQKDYKKSLIYAINNAVFYESAFTEEERNYLNIFDSTEKYYVSLPEESELNGYEDKKLEYPSDYAIASKLSGSYRSGGSTYVNAPFWTKTISSEGDRIKVFWSKQSTTNCVTADSKIGVRPVLKVLYNKGQGGGGGTPSSNPSSGGNAPLIIGIIFTILGAGGLTTFFILWSKKHQAGKPPLWLIISIAGSLVISVVGLGCFAGGLSGGSGGGCLQTGYYVQESQYSGGGIVQVGYTAWLIKSDGTVSYCSHLKDNNTASDFAPDNYMTGKYTINGSKLVIDIPVHEIPNFGKVGGITTFTIKSCTSFKKNSDTFNWVRGE